MKRFPIGALALMACLGPAALRADAPASPLPSLHLTANERHFFDFGYQVGRAAFAYAELGKRATAVAKSHDKAAQLEQLAALAPLAARNRMDAREGFVRARSLLETLQAPSKVLLPVQRAADRLGKPLRLTGDVRRVSLFSGKAAQTLASLDEFNALSSIPEEATLQHWLGTASSGHVWYAEGLVSALAETAAAQQMPELLPPVKEIATDLRGLRDWLSLRLPESPTPDQEALVSALNDFLGQTSRTGRPQTTPLTLTQLQALGDISRRLQSQILGDHVVPPIPQIPRAAPSAQLRGPWNLKTSPLFLSAHRALFCPSSSWSSP